jgi:RNA polymerase sigma factor (TIGR02999 family)
MNDSQADITALLRSWQAGEETAFHLAFPTLYEQLRRQAAGLYFQNPSDTLQPTALVHEAYLRLAGQKTRWESREHFFAVAAVIMRRILVDAARARLTDKRGSGAVHIQIEQALAFVEEKGVDLLALDRALHVLAQIDPRQARIVELRFFGGLSEEETAAVLETSAKTVQRGWAMARAWLRKYMGQLSSAPAPADN